MGRPLALILLLASTAHAGTLSGRVTDENSREPLAGVTVFVQARGQSRQMAITGEDGVWSVAVPGREAYDVSYFYLSSELVHPQIWVGPTSTKHIEQEMAPERWSPDCCEVLLPIPTTLPVTVGTSSWRDVSSYLAHGERPPASTVHIEELVNHVPYTLPPPRDPQRLAITTEVGPTPWNDATKLVRVVLHTSPMATGIVAHDVMLEVEENPDRVAAYRLLGFETVETAGTGLPSPSTSIGAGHAITALYEVTPTPTADAAASSLLFVVKARFTTAAHQPRVLRHTVTDRDVLVSDTTPDFHFAAALAGFGMLLANTPDRADLGWNTVALLAKRGTGADEAGLRRPLLALIQQARWVSP